jgi:hypothetical protein
MDQDLAQIPVAALADPIELRLTTGGVLLRHRAHPRSELSSVAEGCAVADQTPSALSSFPAYLLRVRFSLFFGG